MSNHLLRIFNARVALVNIELKQLEEKADPANSYEAIERWSAAKVKISHQLATLYRFALDMEIFETVASVLYELQQRFVVLPYTPPVTCVTRARNVLQLAPCVVATRDWKPDEQALPELQQVTVATMEKKILFDQLFHPEKEPSFPKPTKTTSLKRSESLPMSKVWSQLIHAISGRYILAYDLALIQLQLKVTAEHLQLPVPILIGESILDLYLEYIGTGRHDLLQPHESEEPVLVQEAIPELFTVALSQENSITTVKEIEHVTKLLYDMANGTLAFSA